MCTCSCAGVHVCDREGCAAPWVYVRVHGRVCKGEGGRSAADGLVKETVLFPK